jgi:hypothetical protein
MGKDTSDNCVNPSVKVSCDIFDRFPLTEPNFRLSEHDGITAEFVNRKFKGHTSAQRWLLEKNGDCFAAQGLFVFLASAPTVLVALRQFKQRQSLFRSYVRSGQKISPFQTHLPSPLCNYGMLENQPICV